MEISKEGFKTVKGIDGSIKFLFDSKRADESCDYAISKGIKIISLYPEVYVAKDLKPILPLANYIEGLLLDDKVNYDELNKFNKLIFLSIPNNDKNIIDLSSFKKLEILNCTLSKKLQGIESCRNLKSLSISNYKSKKKDLTDLPSLDNLKHLSLIKTDITNLKGIERFSNLMELEIFSASKLESIVALQTLSNTLEKIQIERCKKIKDFESLGKVKSLKKAILSESGEIKSIDFVKELNHLKFFSFWGTNVLDGNIKPSKGIEYVGFDEKKHYNLKMKDFKL